MSKIALVTGGNRGIGYEVCRQLAERGLHVLLGSRDRAKGDAAVASLRDGGRVTALELDVVDSEQISAVSTFIREEYGRLDVLVNNAGVYLDAGESVFDVAMDTFRHTMAVNFYGPLRLCREFVPLMGRNGYGRVVNVSSGYGSISQMGGRTAAYRVSKAALNALTRIIAGEARGNNIKVNAVCPGWVRTDMGGRGAPRPVAKGAETIVWAATLPDDGPTDGFFRDKRPLAW